MSALLLVPSLAFRDALLAEGPCGSRPPVAYRFTSGWWPLPPAGEPFADGVVGENEYGWAPKERALVLALEAAPLAEGCDRAIRVAQGAAMKDDAVAARTRRTLSACFSYTEADALSIAEECAVRGLGAVVRT